MRTRTWLLTGLLAACGAKATPRTPTATPVTLEGIWADPMHTAVLRADHEVAFETRRQCARLPCASGTAWLGTWSADGATLDLGDRSAPIRYRLRLDEGGDVLVLAPALGDELRLRRQPAITLAGTVWDAPGGTLSFTADGFERTRPCDDCEAPVQRDVGAWRLEDGTLSLEYDGADESPAVLIEAGGDELVLIGPTETLRYRRRR